MNQTRSVILKNSLLASAGLILFGFGVYLTIQANIGLGPWDCLHEGLARLLHISYGNASVMTSFIILLIDLLLREKLGIGMILDAILVGKAVDFFQYLHLVSPQTSLIKGILCMLAGLVVMGFSQYLYMKAALSCGPRDSMLVGLSRRIKVIPIGVISICILIIVTVCGWLLHAPIGIGTLLNAGVSGPIMQWEFQLLHFDPTAFQHQNLLESMRVLSGQKQQ